MNEEIYSREQKRLALMFNVFMKASFVPGRLIVNKSNPPVHAGGLFTLSSPDQLPSPKISENLGRVKRGASRMEQALQGQ
jgi:hypothetical protein